MSLLSTFLLVICVAQFVILWLMGGALSRSNEDRERLKRREIFLECQVEGAANTVRALGDELRKYMRESAE
jgi:hypothetical protein